MFVVFPYRPFVSFWMIEIIGCFSLQFLLIGLVGQYGSASRAKPVRRSERRVKERFNLKAIIATRDKIHVRTVGLCQLSVSYFTALKKRVDVEFDAKM